jgi:hypothetical protein
LASDMLTEWFVCLVCLVVGELFERVGAVVGLLRNGSDGVWWWCDVGEKKRKRSGEKKRLYARAGTQSGSHGGHVQAGTRRHQLVGEGRHVKLSSVEWQSLTFKLTQTSVKKACDRVSAVAKRILANKCGCLQGSLYYCSATCVLCSLAGFCASELHRQMRCYT